MTKARTLARIETLTWVLIYGGLLSAILGGFTAELDRALAAVLVSVGLVLAVVGVVLIGVRSRLKATDLASNPLAPHAKPPVGSRDQSETNHSQP
jgi:hypothetical protein